MGSLMPGWDANAIPTESNMSMSPPRILSIKNALDAKGSGGDRALSPTSPTIRAVGSSFKSPPKSAKADPSGNLSPNPPDLHLEGEEKKEGGKHGKEGWWQRVDSGAMNVKPTEGGDAAHGGDHPHGVPIPAGQYASMFHEKEGKK